MQVSFRPYYDMSEWLCLHSISDCYLSVALIQKLRGTDIKRISQSADSHGNGTGFAPPILSL